MGKLLHDPDRRPDPEAFEIADRLQDFLVGKQYGHSMDALALVLACYSEENGNQKNEIERNGPIAFHAARYASDAIRIAARKHASEADKLEAMTAACGSALALFHGVPQEVFGAALGNTMYNTWRANKGRLIGDELILREAHKAMGASRSA